MMLRKSSAADTDQPRSWTRAFVPAPTTRFARQPRPVAAPEPAVSEPEAAPIRSVTVPPKRVAPVVHTPAPDDAPIPLDVLRRALPLRFREIYAAAHRQTQANLPQSASDEFIFA